MFMKARTCLAGMLLSCVVAHGCGAPANENPGALEVADDSGPIVATPPVPEPEPDAGQSDDCRVSDAFGCIRPTPDDQDGDRSPASLDCDDHDYYRSHWRNDAPCNGVDENCNGVDDCGPPDVDRDGDPDSTDCAPEDPAISKHGLELICDGIDQDCDGLDPCDRDGDREPEDSDCDDSDPTRSHLAAEVSCDGVDNNCDGADCCEQDDDGDGNACQVDCDDTRQRIHPGATPSTECDYEDRDCDGAIDFLGCDF
jgi:hypothetical protein